MGKIGQFIRTLKERKLLFAANIAGLAVCICAAMLLLFYVQFVRSYDSFHDGTDVYRAESRLYEGSVLTDNWATTTYGHGPVMKREIPGIDNFVRLTVQGKEQTVNHGDKTFIESSYCYTEPSFFEIFNFPLIEGERRQLSKPNTVVISKTAASRYFGEESALGKVLVFRSASSSENFEVTGVIDDMPRNSHLRYDFLLSFATIPPERQEIWYIHGVYTYLKLAPEVAPADVESKFAGLSDKYKTSALKHKIWEVELLPLKSIHLTPQKGYEKETKGNRTALYILTVMSIAILLIGWLNALNIIIARNLERGKLFAVRQAFGASRLQTLWQGVQEAAVINVFAFALVLLLFILLSPVVYSLSGISLFKSMATTTNLLLAGVVFIAGTLIMGIYPSLLSMRIKPIDIMRGNFSQGKKGVLFRKALVTVQFISSFILISGTLITVAQIHFMQQKNRSVVKDNILVIKYPSYVEDIKEKVESFKRELTQNPNIRQVSVSGAIPGVEVANYFTNRRLSAPKDETRLMQMFSVDTDYLQAYNQELVCGRIFSDKHGDEKFKVIVNEEAVKLLEYASNEDAIGGKLTMEVVKEPLEIIGVVRNYHQESLSTEFKPIVFFISDLIPFIPTPYISVNLGSGADRATIDNIAKTFDAFFPTSVFSSFNLEDSLSSQYEEESRFAGLFIIASVISVCVACLGIWIISLFSVIARRKEVGVRKIHGADRGDLFLKLVKGFVGLAGFAALCGIPLSIWIMNKWLSSFAFHTTINWWVYPLTFLLLLLIILSTVSRQIWKSVNMSAVDAMKG